MYYYTPWYIYTIYIVYSIYSIYTVYVLLHTLIPDLHSERHCLLKTLVSTDGEVMGRLSATGINLDKNMDIFPKALHCQRIVETSRKSGFIQYSPSTILAPFRLSLSIAYPWRASHSPCHAYADSECCRIVLAYTDGRCCVVQNGIGLLWQCCIVENSICFCWQCYCLLTM